MFNKKKQQIQALEGELSGIRQVAALQALAIDTFSTAQSKRYAGNEYRDYKTTIAEIAKKYDGSAEWGVLQTGNIIDVRAAFIIGQGVAAIPLEKKDVESNEVNFTRDFFAFNKLSRNMALEMAKEAEIEGCFLGQLNYAPKEKQVSLRFKSRIETPYTIKTAAGDYLDYTSAEFDASGSASASTLAAEVFIYARFGGRLSKLNEPMPKVGKCLTQIEAIDKALRDLREINHLFAAPIPTIECATAEDAEKMAGEAAKINWALRKLIAISGRFVFAAPNLQYGSESLDKEITTNAKMISGTTGTPPHFLGFPELLSNRSTADNLMESVAASTSKERGTWLDAYEEILRKAFAIYNENSGLTPLDPKKIKIVIPFVTAEAWKRISDIYLPLFLADGLSLSTLLSQIPELDVDREIEAIDAKNNEALDRFSKGGLDRDKKDVQDKAVNNSEEGE
ncbi:MAG: hypothetical protein IMZ57_11125 [Acidobacteria bacterium]|nr:hypothetical protein [Acidobacteriota bacterium]